MTGERGVVSDTPNSSESGENALPRPDPTRTGRWGIRQFKKGEPTGGGTVGLGWATEAAAGAANPPRGDYSYEAFDRFGGSVT